MKMLAKCGEGTRIFVLLRFAEMLDNEAFYGTHLCRRGHGARRVVGA